MKLNVVVLMKQVPDIRTTNNDVLLPDGSINRAILPTIVNPNDMYALEQALLLKDMYPEATVTVLSMGPMQAADVVREGWFRGADKGVLLCDKQFAGSDTLATSYTLAQAIKQLAPVDLVLCGSQSIDGDTAHVASQVACHLGWPQFTFANALQVEYNQVTVERQIENGVEKAQTSLPVVISVTNQAPVCRPKNAKNVMMHKRTEVLLWSLNDIQADANKCGWAGSPTRVANMKPLAWQAKEAQQIEPTDTGIATLMQWIVR